ncbi:MAG: hypothetical protein ACREBB_11290, partial [Nitrosotalea sp.]
GAGVGIAGAGVGIAGAGVGIAGAGVGIAGAGVGIAGAGVGIMFALFVFEDALSELSAKESGKAYCGKIKITESKSGIKNFVFILPYLRFKKI